MTPKKAAKRSRKRADAGTPTAGHGHGDADATPRDRAAVGPRTLSIDVGGSKLKAAVLDAAGAMTGERVRVPTPDPVSPAALVDAVADLASRLPAYDRISVGFPGVVREGRTLTAANLGDPAAWHGVDLKSALEERLGGPVRILNDAEVQGLGVIEGHGLEMIVTLGTGVGTGLFLDGRPTPHLELAHHPFRKGQTYEQQLGAKALERVGKRVWNRRLEKAIDTLRALTNFDRLYLGGGNARKVDLTLDPDTAIVSNVAGILGGIALWREPGDLPPRQPAALRPDEETDAAAEPPAAAPRTHVSGSG